MQIRVQGKKIQLIRSIYNHGTKRCDQKLIGTLDKYDKILSDETAKILSDEERQELDKYLSDQQIKEKQSLDESRVSVADITLSNLADALAVVEIDGKHADIVWAGLAAVQKALKKAGHPKPKRSQQTKKQINQGDLL